MAYYFCSYPEKLPLHLSLVYKYSRAQRTSDYIGMTSDGGLFVPEVVRVCVYF